LVFHSLAVHRKYFGRLMPGEIRVMAADIFIQTIMAILMFQEEQIVIIAFLVQILFIMACFL
jgi:hypothetical protein